MEVEGMVHALEEIKRLLKPDGFLVDIHPVREEPLIQIYQRENLLFSESDPGYDYDESLQHADEALEEVIHGWFHLEALNLSLLRMHHPLPKCETTGRNMRQTKNQKTML
jgi:hypothetical protein